MKRKFLRRIALAGSVALLGTACAPAEDGSYVSPAPRRSRPPAARAATEPARRAGAEVTFVGSGGARLERARADLRDLGLWHRLTRDLDEVRLEVVSGADRVPPDRHLADAVLRTRLDLTSIDRICKIQFFPSAIFEDLVRQGRYHSAGLLGPPPVARDFWAALLAHELVHCRPKDHGEARARGMERRVLALLLERDVVGR